MKDYILIKLRSGEEIIATIITKSRKGVKIFRPMQIRQIPFVDPISGSLKAAVVMENWIGRTESNEVTIPNNWVGIMMLPSQDSIDVYEKQMEKEDVRSSPSFPPKEELPLAQDPLTASLNPHQEDQPVSNPLKEIEDEMNRLMLDMMNPMGSTASSVPVFFPPMENFDKSAKGDKEMVIVNFMFPPKIFKHLMEEGLMEDFIITGMSFNENGDDSMEEDEDSLQPKAERTEKTIRENDVDIKEKGDEPYGNSYRDWSSNPNDYIQ